MWAVVRLGRETSVLATPCSERRLPNWRTGHRKFNSGKWLLGSFCAAAAGVLLGDGAERPPRGWPWARATHSRLSENRVSLGKALGEAVCVKAVTRSEVVLVLG